MVWVGCCLTLHPVCLKVDPKVAVPDDVSQRSGRGGGGGIPETKKTNKVFVGGVPHEMDEETISSYFKKFGEVSVGEPGVDWTPASMVHQAKTAPLDANTVLA